MPLLVQGFTAGLIIPPAIAVVVAALPMLGDAAGLRRSAATCRHRIGITIRIGRLVHELQKERGLSVAALSRRDEASAKALNDQRPLVVTAQSALLAALAEASQSGGEAMDGIRSLESLRQRIDLREVGTPEAVQGFSGIIAQLLGLSSDMVRGAARGRLTRLALAAVNLMSGKEMAGQERALVSGILGAGTLDEGQRRRLVQVIGGQDIYLGLYRDLAGAQALDGDLAQLDPPVMAVRGTLLDGDRMPAVTVAEWFAQATARIDVLKAHEDRLAATLLSAADHLEGVSRRRPWTIALTAAGSAIILGAAAVMLPLGL